MPPTELVKALPDDSFLASVLRRKKRSLTETVPPDIDPREALANIKECVTSLNKLGNATSVVGAILGAHMALMAKREDILGASGYDSLREFEQAEIIDKISHGSAWNWKRISTAFPEASIEQLMEAGSTNLLRAAKVCPPDASAAQREKILNKAVELNTTQFVEFLEHKSGVSAPGETTTDTFQLIGSSAEIEQLKTWFADPRFVEFNSNDNRPIGMVLAAIEESSSVWPKEPDKPLQTGEDDGAAW